jgi:hypothetical protein
MAIEAWTSCQGKSREGNYVVRVFLLLHGKMEFMTRREWMGIVEGEVFCICALPATTGYRWRRAI